MVQATLSTEVRALSRAELRDLEAEWTALARRTAPPHYSLAHAWLTQWASVYAPRRLLLIRITGPEGVTRGLGLLEAERGRRWRFAGGAVTPRRGLLCDPADETAVWAAWADWLAAHRSRWAILEGSGVPAAAAQLPGAHVEPVAEYALALPASFEAYLAARPRGSRRGLRQKLNRLPRLGGEVRAIEPQEHRSFIGRFVSLHGARAAHKGERHPAVDARLGELLLSLPADGDAPQLRLFALEAGGRTAGVSVRLDWGGIAYFYNAGFDPDAAAMSPGVVLELASIRDAIHRGLSRFDLGPGEYRYKRDLGGVRHEAGRLIATSPSLAGAAARAAYRARKRLR